MSEYDWREEYLPGSVKTELLKYQKTLSNITNGEFVDILRKVVPGNPFDEAMLRDCENKIAEDPDWIYRKEGLNS